MLMLDLKHLDGIHHDLCNGVDGFYYMKPGSNKKYYGFSEGEANQWLVKGKTLSGKTFFRRICWDCFFKRLRATVDIDRLARKGKWYAKLVDGSNVVPHSSMHASRNVFPLLFDITDEELEKERLKLATGTLESKIMRYGVEEGTRRWNAYRKRQSYTCSKEYMMNEKGMTEDEWHKFNANRASTKENFIKRYGEEEGVRRWESYCAYESYAGCTLIWFINKLGKEEGTKEYIRVCDAKLAMKPYSDVSQKMFEEIDKVLGEYAIESYWAKKNYEFELRLPIDIKYIMMLPKEQLKSIDTSYGFDLQQAICSMTTDKNEAKQIAVMTFRPDYWLHYKIIEFNGDFWHANPKIYNENDMLPRPGNTYESAKDIWERDKTRYERFMLCGFKVHVVWESDYVDDPERTVDECVKFLRD